MPDHSAIIALEDEVDRRLPQTWMAQQPSPAYRAAAGAWSAAVWESALASGPYLLEAGAIDAGLRLAASPVFVCGTHRSGTTLMQGLLDDHPALSVLPSEGGFLTELQAKIAARPDHDRCEFITQEWLRRLVNPGGHHWLLGRTDAAASPSVDFATILMAWWSTLAAPPPPGVAAPPKVPPSMRPLVAVALAYGTHAGRGRIRPQVERWVDKTPTNELHLDRLLAAFPAGKVVLMVRDPRDVFASHKLLEERLLGRFSGERRVLKNLSRSHAIAAGHRTDVLRVRYEDLVGDPAGTLREVAAYLGIEFDEVLLHPTTAGRPSAPNSSFEGRRTAACAIIDSPVPLALTAAEVGRISAYAGETARRLGYALPTLEGWRRYAIKCRCATRALIRRARPFNGA